MDGFSLSCPQVLLNVVSIYNMGMCSFRIAYPKIARRVTYSYINWNGLFETMFWKTAKKNEQRWKDGLNYYDLFCKMLYLRSWYVRKHKWHLEISNIQVTLNGSCASSASIVHATEWRMVEAVLSHTNAVITLFQIKHVGISAFTYPRIHVSTPKLTIVSNF